MPAHSIHHDQLSPSAQTALAWIDLHERGKGWRNRFAIGMRALLREFPDMKETIAACETAAEDRKRELAESADDSGDDGSMLSRI
jgi:hypothetical protein